MAKYECGHHTLIRTLILSIFKDNEFMWTCFLSYEERCPAYLNQESLSSSLPDTEEKHAILVKTSGFGQTTAIFCPQTMGFAVKIAWATT